MTPPVLVAPDAFKGTFTAAQVAAAIGRGLERAGLHPPDLCPIADGGEGTVGALLLALGGETGGARVTGPLGEPVTAGFALLDEGGTALLEVAAAAGFAQVGTPTPETAWRASTRGVGELIVAAAATGAEVVLVAAGGSATTDGGAGAVAAIEDAGGLGGATVVVLCDVRTTFRDAPRTFAPQKGADPDTVARLEDRLATLPWARACDGVPMTGAAGGLAGGLASLGARLVPGAPFVLDELDFDARMRAARAVIVGEGRLDQTTLQGKAAGEAATRARQAGVPCHAIVGQDGLDPLGRRILDLQTVDEATTLEELEAVAERLAADQQLG